MKLKLITLGQINKGPLFELIEHYKQRLRWPLQIITPPKKSPSTQLNSEILKEDISKSEYLIAFDESGTNMTSEEMANLLLKLEGQAIKETSLLIGGADGISEELLQKANTTLSFGRCTWPHLLMRVLLLEQLYRASCIIEKHPYHRSGKIVKY